jgi:hypothetical protein
VLRARHSPPALPLRAGVLMAVLVLGAASASAQTPEELDRQSLRPTLDGSPGNPPSFLRSRSDPRDSDTPRIGEIPKFGYQSALGAGASGFDSTNTGRPKAKNSAKPKAGAVTKTGRAARPTLDAAGRATGAAPAPGAMAVAQPIGAARLPQNRTRQGGASTPDGAFATTAATEPQPLLRRLPPIEQNQFDPVGVTVGGFRLRPAIEVTGGYDSNPARTANGKPSWFAVVAPELLANSNWANHELTAAIRSSYTAYDTATNLDRPALDAKVTGRVDVSRYTHLNLESTFIVGTDNPGSPNIQSDLSRLPIFTTLGGAAGLTQSFNRLDVSLKGIAERTVYQNSSFIDGSTASNADRDYNRFGSELRTSYELTPGVKPFVELGADSRIHDIPIDRSGMRRDSDGWYVKAGSTFELTRLIVGDMSIGYLTRTYKDPSLPDLSGLLVDGSLVWTATTLTTVKLTGKTSASETTVAGVSGIFSRDVGLQVDHAFRRWLIATLKVGAGFDEYRGSTREDERYTVSLGLAYALSRDLQLKGEFRQEWRHSNSPGIDYAASVVLFGVRLQR